MMPDTKKLNTTYKRLQIQCFRNYVLCNAVDEKLNDLNNAHQELKTKLNDLNNAHQELKTKLNDLDNDQRELKTKFTKQINTEITEFNNKINGIYTIITIILLTHLACVFMFIWWFL